MPNDVQILVAVLVGAFLRRRIKWPAIVLIARNNGTVHLLFYIVICFYRKRKGVTSVNCFAARVKSEAHAKLMRYRSIENALPTFLRVRCAGFYSSHCLPLSSIVLLPTSCFLSCDLATVMWSRNSHVTGWWGHVTPVWCLHWGVLPPSASSVLHIRRKSSMYEYLKPLVICKHRMFWLEDVFSARRIWKAARHGLAVGKSISNLHHKVLPSPGFAAS